MIVNVPAVVLSRRNFREADRLCVLYTETFGKMTARFIGVNKPKAKLKALSEPIVSAEYRLYLKPGAGALGDGPATVVGGRIIDSFPAVRETFLATVEALACCELLAALTPERSPNPAKYRLICEALAEAGAPLAPSNAGTAGLPPRQIGAAGRRPWLVVAFGLRLLELAGLRPDDREVFVEDRETWESLRAGPLARASGLAWGREREGRLRGLVYRHAEAHAGRELKSRLFMEKMAWVPA